MNNKSEIGKGFNTQTIKYVPSEFRNYRFRNVQVSDLSISAVTNLSILAGDLDLDKLVEIYSPCFLNLTKEEVGQLLYIDFIPLVHFINHLSFGTYDNSFTYKACKCGKPHTVKYNLYDVNFSKPENDFNDNLINVEPWTVRLHPFTVDSMSLIMSSMLEENKLAFTFSCIGAIFNSDGKELEKPDNLLDGIEWLSQFPNRLKLLVDEAISKRYPNTLPLVYKFSCGETLTFIPDMTLKGLPSFASVKGD
jgi:hypothetical protein